MAYSADTFVADEQPTTAKWNKLWSNDASFNDGTGIGTNAIAAASLASNALTIGYAQSTSAFSTSSTSFVDVTGLTTGAITVPAGGRQIEVSIRATAINVSGAGSIWALGLAEDGTIIQQWYRNSATSAYNIPLDVSFSKTPTAGSHTYKARLATTAGTVQMGAGTTSNTPVTAGPMSIHAKMV